MTMKKLSEETEQKIVNPKPIVITIFMIHWTWDFKVLGLPYWSQIDFIIYWTWTNLKKLVLPYWTGIKLSVKQFVIQSSPISLGQIMCGV